MTDQLAGRVDDDASEPLDTVVAAEPDDADRDDVDVDAARAPAGSRRPWRRSGRPRVSRWDRPPEPHDWRFYVGTLGKVLIVTGLLMFGFVAYQLWGTGIETARAQNRLEGEFAALLEEFADGEVDDPPAASAGSAGEGTENPADEPAISNAVADDDASNLDGRAGSGDQQPAEITEGEVTQGVPVAIDLSDEAVVQEPLPQPFRGDPLFRLEIPAIDRDDIVVAGVSLGDLKAGPGHYDDTPLPGQLGNASVAGHRTTYGSPFHHVDRLRVGDELITTLANGDRFVYEVTAVEIVEASDYWVVTTRDPNIAELTLTSCHPKWTARQRIVVHSVMNPAKSSNVGFPTFYELTPDETPIPGDDPVLVADEVSPDDIAVTGPDSALTDPDDAPAASRADGTEVGDDAGRADSGSTNPDDGGVTAADGSSTSAAERSTPAAAPGDPTDAFSQGWFDDDAAWPQIALWGALLLLVSVLAYQLAKRTRRSSIGVLVGIAPFLFALFFFYQNVNRLLPPGL